MVPRKPKYGAVRPQVAVFSRGRQFARAKWFQLEGRHIIARQKEEETIGGIRSPMISFLLRLRQKKSKTKRFRLALQARWVMPNIPGLQNTSEEGVTISDTTHYLCRFAPSLGKSFGSIPLKTGSYCLDSGGPSLMGLRRREPDR